MKKPLIVKRSNAPLGLFATLSLFVLLSTGRLEAQESTEAQPAPEISENSDASLAAPVTAPAPAPPPKQYIDPFSGMPLPEYSYTNSLPVPSRWRTLTVDPFSGTPLPPLVAPAPPKPVVEESEPQFTPPIQVELPPGSRLARGTTRQSTTARPAPRLWEMLFSETRWDFPPGAILRRR